MVLMGLTVIGLPHKTGSLMLEVGSVYRTRNARNPRITTSDRTVRQGGSYDIVRSHARAFESSTMNLEHCGRQLPGMSHWASSR